MHHPTDPIAYTTAFVTPVVKHWLEREIAKWVHHFYKEKHKGKFLTDQSTRGLVHGRGMCYPVYQMVHINDPLLLIGKSSPCSYGYGFPSSLSEWSFYPMSDAI